MHHVGRSIGCALAGVAVAGWCATVPAASAAAAHSAETITFQYTGGPQTLTIPSWASHATFKLYGAVGGGFALDAPGYGGVTEADLPVTAGETIVIMAGGAGRGPRCLPQTVVPNPGGFNGGGAGGYQSTSENKNNCSGGSGGGATDIRIGGHSLADRVLVAGGGGGASSCAAFFNEFAFGGPGGGLTGGSGGCDGGVGGGQTASSGSGLLGVGGNGEDPHCNFFYCNNVAGGGGGGGYYGGAGGRTVSGGGGGSGYGPPGTVFSTGVWSGAGGVKVTIADTYTPTMGFDIAPNGENGWFRTPTATGSVTVTDVATGGRPIEGLDCYGLRGVSIGTPVGLGTPTATLSFAVTATRPEDQGVTRVTCWGYDAGHNTVTQTIEVKIDSFSPVGGLDPAADHCSLPGHNGWCRGVQTAGFTAHDGTSGLAQPTHSPFTRSTDTEGAAVIIWSHPLVDRAGNADLGAVAGPFRIDHTAPVFPAGPIPVKITNRQKTGAIVTYPTPVAGDNFDPNPAVHCTPASGTRFPIRTTTIVCTATDEAGNHGTYRQDVHVTR